MKLSMKSLQEFLRLAFAALIIGLGVGYALASSWGVPPGPPPTGPCQSINNPPGPGEPPYDPNCNAPEPINVGGLPNPQTKNGNLVINGDLTAGQNLFTAIGNGTKVTIGSDAFNNPLPTAILDVAGQIRIRGGSPGVGRVLTAVSDPAGGFTGLAKWQLPPSGLTSLKEGFGIDLCNYNGTSCITSEITGTGMIMAAGASSYRPGSNKGAAEIQNRLVNSCASPKAITVIDELGNATCQNFVTTVQVPVNSGLTLLSGSPPTSTTTPGTAVSGPLALKIYTGTASDNTGLKINGSNQVALNVDSSPGNSGDGLTITGSALSFETCAANKTWKYDTSFVPPRWACADLPVPPGGESVMYLRSVSTSTPATCPGTCGSGGWCGVAVTNENVGNGIQNSTRVCYRSDWSCQVVYVRAPINTSQPPCPTITGGWTTTINSNEWAPGGTSKNFVTTCAICY